MKKILRFAFLPVLAGTLFTSLGSFSSGVTGKSTSGCGGSGCHNSSASTLITLTGLPANYTPGTTYALTLNVANAGASFTGAGMNLTTSAGIIVAPVPAGMALTGTTELNHTATKPMVSGISSFSFNWTAPLSGSVTFNAAGNAVNGNGMTSGDGYSTFTTTINAAAAPTPIITTTAATSITPFAATLNGTANANGVTPGIGLQFEYGLTTAYGTTVTGSPATATGSTAVNTSATISSLLPNTTYHYRLKASQITAPATNGNDMTFTTGINSSVNDIEKAGINIYPNPTNNNITLQNVTLESPKFFIVDLTGKTTSVMATSVNNNNYTFNTQSLATGNYILQITSKDKVFTTKFSKQ